jgi:hypothetical protein
LALDRPAPFDATRTCPDAGEITAGVGLAPTLRPDLFPRAHGWKEPALLLVGAELEHGRRQQEDAVLPDTRRSANPIVLLFEDQPLPE